jgi:tRNA-(ms[2]io[6]A)-hydroxylase
MLCLKVPTDRGWAAAALRDVDAVLADHAHCEMKAASNALSLAARHPGDATLVRALTDLAREEIDHFQRVLALLGERGVTLGPPPVDVYAAELRRAANAAPRDPAVPPLVDRLLVGALIEARSCERFKLLAAATAGAPDGALRDAAAVAAEVPAADCRALHAIWSELLAAEARHYATFVDLATRAAGGDRALASARLDLLARLEGDVVAAVAARAAAAEASRASIHG